jgi:HSP20 family protein
MPQVAVTKLNDEEKKTQPIFGEIARRLEAVQQRAFDLFEKRGREVGHELDDWFRAEHELLGRSTAELAEQDRSYQVQVALPGFEAGDIEVTATPTGLIVHAAAEKQNETEENSVLWTEFGSSDVYRRFEVPIAINVDQVTAKLDNGILQINAPKVTKGKEPKAAAA